MGITSSVIICTRNRRNDLIRALASLAMQTVLPTELIIVDSSEIKLLEQESFTKIFNEQQFPGVRLVYKYTTPGLTKQRNEGVALATSKIVYFFDDDVELESTYLEEMNKIFESNPAYGGGMGSVTNIGAPASWRYRLLRKLFLLQQDYSSGRFTWSGMPTHAYGNKKFQEVEVLGGCCFAFRKKVLLEQPFDEELGYYAYMEDCDVSKRVCNTHKLFFNPRARLKHFHSPVARDKVVDNRAMYVKNYSYLFFKNFYPQNKFRVLGYVWSLGGLFLEGILCRRFDELRGYCRGLKKFYGKEK